MQALLPVALPAVPISHQASQLAVVTCMQWQPGVYRTAPPNRTAGCPSLEHPAWTAGPAWLCSGHHAGHLQPHACLNDLPCHQLQQRCVVPSGGVGAPGMPTPAGRLDTSSWRGLTSSAGSTQESNDVLGDNPAARPGARDTENEQTLPSPPRGGRGPRRRAQAGWTPTPPGFLLPAYQL